MDIYVRTRGLEKDYRFLGEAPAEFWWRKYRAWTDTEGSTILLESDASSWRAYIAGISSARRDLSDRPIQFNLALAGPHEPAGAAGAEERDLVLTVLARSVTDLADQRGGSISGLALDEALPQETVERMLASTGEETLRAAAAAVRTAYEADANAGGPWETELPAAWTAGVANPDARASFLSFAAGLLGGKPGLALVLNLLATAADAAEVAQAGLHAEAGAGLAVLAARPGSPLDGEVTELAVKKGETPRLPQPYQDPSRPVPVPGPGPLGSGQLGSGQSRPSRHPVRSVAAMTVAAAVVLAAVTFGVIRIEQSGSTSTPAHRPSSHQPTLTHPASPSPSASGPTASPSRTATPRPKHGGKHHASRRPSSQPTP